jgi:protein PhnA
MSSEHELLERCGNKCELCGSPLGLVVYALPASVGHADHEIVLCETCRILPGQYGAADTDHWRCLGDSMWSTVPAVQVMAWRLLKQLSTESWAQDLLDMLYLDDELANWAKAGVVAADEAVVYTKDSNGTILQAGDTVTIIKDLDVKGTSFVAKRGTAVRNIALTDNPEHIEGKVNGTRIVLLTCFVKKSGL